MSHRNTINQLLCTAIIHVNRYKYTPIIKKRGIIIRMMITLLLIPLLAMENSRLIFEKGNIILLMTITND